MARTPSICPDCGGVEGTSCCSDEACYRNQAANHLATIAEIRAILAEPVREIVENTPLNFSGFYRIHLHGDQWKRLHELLGGDHAAHANREGK